jgi:hypothetical protein
MTECRSLLHCERRNLLEASSYQRSCRIAVVAIQAHHHRAHTRATFRRIAS